MIAVMVSVASFASLANSANAQVADTSRARMLRELDSLIAQTAAIAVVPTTAQMTQQALRGQPGSSAGSTGAWGASWGDVFAGVGFQSRARYSKKPDGSGSFGFGLGDPRSELGLEVAVSSVSTIRQGVGNNGTVSLKVHRVLPGDYGVAVGFENVANWGGPDGGSSVYGVVSHTINIRPKADLPFGSLAFNVGVGNSRYLTEQALAEGKTLYDKGQAKKAMVPLEKAVTLKPNGDEALVLLANCFLDRGNMDKAIGLAELAAAANAENADAYLVVGAVQQQKGHNSEARTAYEKYLQLAPKGQFAGEIRSILASLH